jgi:hypothetical protein
MEETRHLLKILVGNFKEIEVVESLRPTEYNIGIDFEET